MAPGGAVWGATMLLLFGAALLCSCGDSNELPPLDMSPPFSPPMLLRSNSLKARRNSEANLSTLGSPDDAMMPRRGWEKPSRQNLRRTLYLGELVKCQDAWYEDKMVLKVDSSSSSSASMMACPVSDPQITAPVHTTKPCPHGLCYGENLCEHSDADELCTDCDRGWGDLELEEEPDEDGELGGQDGEDDGAELLNSGVESGQSNGCPLGPVAFGDSGEDDSSSIVGIYEREFHNSVTGEVYDSCITIGQGSFGRAWRCTESGGLFVTVKEFFIDDRYSFSKAIVKAKEEMETELIFGKFVLKNTNYCIPVLSGWTETISLGVGFSDEDDAEESDSEDETAGFRVAQGYGGANLDKIRFDYSGTLELDVAYVARIRSYGVELFLSAGVMRERMTGLLEGLHYMHSQGVVHSDVKPTNLVFNNQIRFIDYGLSVCMSKWGVDDQMKPVTTPCSRVPEMEEQYLDSFRGGTREYSPPERYLRKKGMGVFYDMNPGAYDIFSAGLVFMEWAAGRSLSMSGRMIFWLPRVENHAMQFDRCSLKTFVSTRLFDPSVHKENVAAWYRRLYEPNTVRKFIQQNPWSRFGMEDLDDAKAFEHLIRAMINCKPSARPTARVALTHAFFTNGSKPYVCPNGRRVWFKYTYDKCMAKSGTKAATIRIPRGAIPELVKSKELV